MKRQRNGSGEARVASGERRKRRGSARQRGVIMIIALLGIILLGALVLWVTNLGQQVNNRISTQHAADATAQDAAGWVARSLNTVAINNVDMARYIALVDNIDSFPAAVDMANRETHSLFEALQNQLNAGITGITPAPLEPIVVGYYQQLLSEMDQQIAQLDPVDNLFKTNDVTGLTFYTQNGSFWRAMSALDEVNQAISENLATMAQTAALRGGEVNRVNGDSAVAVVTQQLPTRRGGFDDFERPVTLGLLPTTVDDKTVNRGPWDAVFGWRDVRYEREGGTYVPGGVDGAGGGGANNPLSRGGSNDGKVVGGTVVPISYSAYGPYSWMRRRISTWCDNNVPHTRLDFYHARVSAIKMNQLWPGSVTVRDLTDPDWRITYDEAVSIAAAGDPPIRETGFFVVEIKSKYPADDSRFLSDGTWTLERNRQNGGVNPRVQRVGGWQDPAHWGIPMICPYVWRDDWSYMCNWDNTIGITPVYTTVTNPDGTTSQEIVKQPVYRVDHIAFGGVNVGPDAVVRNPWPPSTSAPDVPAPTDLDHNIVTLNDQQAHWTYLSYLGIARAGDLPMAWPSRFRGGRPYPNVVSLAQARVFNNHSWDLWTPMWRAEMEPITDYDGWLTRLGTSAGITQQANLADLQQYLAATRDLAILTLGH